MRAYTWSVSVTMLAAIMLACAPKPQQYPIRWVYISNGLRNDDQLEEFRELAKTASEHGLNGIYLSSGFDARARSIASLRPCS